MTFKTLAAAAAIATLSAPAFAQAVPPAPSLAALGGGLGVSTGTLLILGVGLVTIVAAESSD